jgi:hypothetical protein
MGSISIVQGFDGACAAFHHLTEMIGMVVALVGAV